MYLNVVWYSFLPFWFCPWLQEKGSEFSEKVCILCIYVNLALFISPPFFHIPVRKVVLKICLKDELFANIYIYTYVREKRRSFRKGTLLFKIHVSNTRERIIIFAILHFEANTYSHQTSSLGQVVCNVFEVLRIHVSMILLKKSCRDPSAYIQTSKHTQ